MNRPSAYKRLLLANKTKTKYFVHNKTLLTLSPERQVSVKLAGDKTVQLSATHTDTVRQLKVKLQLHTGPPTFGHLLVLENVTLLDLDLKVGNLDLAEEEVIGVRDLTGWWARTLQSLVCLD